MLWTGEARQASFEPTTSRVIPKRIPRGAHSAAAISLLKREAQDTGVVCGLRSGSRRVSASVAMRGGAYFVARRLGPLTKPLSKGDIGDGVRTVQAGKQCEANEEGLVLRFCPGCT